MTYKLDIGATNLRLYKDDTLVNEKKFSGNINQNSALAHELVTYLRVNNVTNDILIGIAGYYTCGEVIKKDLNNLLKEKLHNFKVVSDAEYHAMHLINNDQLLISLGTGSVASYYNNDEFNIIGGYGHTLGDIGSGYHFGKLCIINYMHNFEANVQFDYMGKLENHFDVKGRNLLSKVLDDEKSNCSNLAVLFMDDNAFDHIFIEYFKQFIHELNRCLNVSQKQQVIINGSITKSLKFKEQLSNINTNVTII